MTVRPKKSLGQHFLRDENIARKIVQGLDVDSGSSIFEIGPGTGVLTKYLLELYPNIEILEIDKEAWAFLQNRFPEHADRIILGDVLKFDFPGSLPPPIHIIGNFPYNISSQIFFRVLENRQEIAQVVCMIQKEVADRIRAPHGSKTYGILSVLLQAFFDIEYLFTVSAGVFTPAPRVQSAVIRLKRNNRKHLDCDEKMFFRVVKASFNHRRKTLRNSLKGLFLIPEQEDEIFSLRPEQLPVDRFIELTTLLSIKDSS